MSKQETTENVEKLFCELNALMTNRPAAVLEACCANLFGTKVSFEPDAAEEEIECALANQNLQEALVALTAEEKKGFAPLAGRLQQLICRLRKLTLKVSSPPPAFLLDALAKNSNLELECSVRSSSFLVQLPTGFLGRVNALKLTRDDADLLISPDLVQSFPALRHISARMDPSAAAKMLWLPSSCQSVELQSTHSILTREEVRGLADALAVTHVSSVRLNMRVRRLYFAELLRASSRNSRLTHVYFNVGSVYNPDDDHADIEHAAEALTVRSLEVSSSQQVLSAVQRGLRTNANTTELSMACVGSWVSLAAPLPAVRKLTLRGDPSFRRYEAPLVSFHANSISSVTELHVHDTRLPVGLATRLFSHPLLTTLVLDGCVLSGLGPALSQLRTNRTLVRLSLARNPLTAFDHRALASALRRNQTLTALDVSHTGALDSWARYASAATVCALRELRMEPTYWLGGVLKIKQGLRRSKTTFLMGMHPRAGAESSIGRTFLRCPLFEAQLVQRNLQIRSCGAAGL